MIHKTFTLQEKPGKIFPDKNNVFFINSGRGVSVPRYYCTKMKLAGTAEECSAIVVLLCVLTPCFATLDTVYFIGGSGKIFGTSAGAAIVCIVVGTLTVFISMRLNGKEQFCGFP